MENLDYTDIITKPEANSLQEAFNISDERAEEIERCFVKGCDDFGKSMEANTPNLTKADIYLHVSRAGFTPQNPSELAYMTMLISERITRNDMLGSLATIIGEDSAKLLFSLIKGSSACGCAKCKAKRGETE